MTFLHPHDRILFQGDSITDAFRKPDEINNAYQLGAGYVLLIAAELLAARPRDGLLFFNRGISGNRVADLRARWQVDCLDLEPSVLNLLVGVNDTALQVAGVAGSSVAEYADQYRQLLEQTRRARPSVRFILCEPFLLRAGKVTEDWVRDLAARRAVVKDLAREYHAVFVPFQAAFDQAATQAPAVYWSYDGVHPTAAGFGLMARVWLDTLAG